MSGNRLALTAIALTTILVAAGCRPSGEVREESFDDRDEAVASGLIERGWIPGFLPASAAAIHLKYDIGTNEAALTFAYDPADIDELIGACAAIPLVPTPTLQADWLPPGVAVDADRSFVCDDGYVVADGGVAYYWSTDAGLSVVKLDADPEKYAYLDGERAVIIGYLDFGNIFDTRETEYGYEAVGFVRKPGQFADPVMFAVFPSSSDPHPLFDEIYANSPADEGDGLQLIVAGRLELSEQPTNFATDLGWGMNVVSPVDVVVLTAANER